MVNALYHDTNGKFRKGHIGGPGRPPGHTYTRHELIKTINERGYDPIVAMVDLAEDPHSSNYLKFEIAKEIASYLLPKQKAVQLQDASGQPATLTIKWDVDEPADKAYDHAKQQFIDGVSNAVETIMDAVSQDDPEDDR